MENGDEKSARQLRPMGSYLERISMLFKVGTLIGAQKNMRALLDLLMREAPSVVNAERATIFLADQAKQELYSHMGVGLKHDQIRIPWDSGIAGWVFMHGQSLNIADPYTDPRFNRAVDPRTGFKTKNLLCVPMRAPGQPVIGVFQVLNKRAGVFTTTDLEILEILASQAARAVENVLEWDDLRHRATLLKKENVDLKEALKRKDPLEAIVGRTHAIQEVRALIRKVAGTDTTVLIQGESGTGKEIVAKAIHQLSNRSEGPLISLNCAAVPAELIESELFGHKRGAFTGATHDHPGVFRSAHDGTLFLDEIEATSPAMQVKLLRSIQSREIKPVGDNSAHHVNVRLITASNRDLQHLVSEGAFRADLFYRINVFPIVIPPLRDRNEDIPVLAEHFLEKISLQSGKWVRGIDTPVMELFQRYHWPGNARELENEIERAHVLTSEGQSISVRNISPRITQTLERGDHVEKPEQPRTIKDAVDSLERKMIVDSLREAHGNRSLAAKRLGLSRQGLLNKMQRFGLEGL
jgi:Nif-specific regulatory protein